jgi:hypothetical protein
MLNPKTRTENYLLVNKDSCFYHEEEKDGLVKICRLAMYKKYPKYPTEGFEALYSRPPVIYVSASSKPGVSNYLHGSHKR